jgi:hypothetical protein
LKLAINGETLPDFFSGLFESNRIINSQPGIAKQEKLLLPKLGDRDESGRI